MLLTPKALLLKKLEFLVGRPLTAEEHMELTKKIKVGNNAEISAAVNKLRQANRKFEAPHVIIEKYSKNQDLSKLSQEELINLVEDIVVKTTSVQAGLRILKKAKSMSKMALIRYIYNFYLQDVRKREKKGNREAITNDQSNRPPVGESMAAPLGFENPVKLDRLLPIDEYDSKDEYLNTEFRNRPSHNEPKKLTIKERIKNYIQNFIGKPTGGKEDVGNQKN